MTYTFHTPVKLVVDQPVADALPAALAELSVTRVLLISDAGLEKIGLVAQIAGLLQAESREVATFAQVKSNPTVADVNAAGAVGRAVQAEAIVALGGGSVIDVGKATGLLATNGGVYADYQLGGRPITRPILPLIAVPTTAGTGSEMTRVAVIEDEATRAKRGVLSPHMFARTAILDAALTLSLPASLTAATGADVLGHALEALMGRRANPITDALALAAARRAWGALPRAVHEGADLAARQTMLLASALAGWAFDQSGLGLIHALAGPLTGRFGLHHGLCIGLLLPHGLAYNLPALGDKRASITAALGLPGDAPDAAVVAAVTEWLAGLGLPTASGQVQGVDLADITPADCAEMGEAAARMSMMPNNPRPASAADCARIFETGVFGR